jgi:prolipoprotein diacylglyceryltransferase
VEGLRTDSLMLGNLRAAQVMSLLLVAGSGIGLLLMAAKKKS